MRRRPIAIPREFMGPPVVTPEEGRILDTIRPRRAREDVIANKDCRSDILRVRLAIWERLAAHHGIAIKQGVLKR